ncbi:hypothetical protein CAPTEDRAFT_174498 [Capitella teleta]|uniref:TOM1-like protein 2 n=1 Tax=Capitella teleta TaxID=283909 RepID=R7V155_CAPTE|nr:hypothetical protein CAPTEDRAFT_174498 [Capitella teleta]|eukprot:ELU12259.1 hypothetical protein CAPTEDRAFT_174498 [Capitella teleta]
MSFFGSNPFSTPCGQVIQVATDGAQDSENWSAFMDICDMINETEDGPKDAIKALKKRLSSHSGKNYTAVMHTLTLLETCVKNCGLRFHVQVTQKDFLQEMVKIIGPKNDPPQVVQEKVLSLIQTWADAFQGQPDLKEVCKVFQDLKHKGIEFPMTDLDSMAPIHTPARTEWSRPAANNPAVVPPQMQQPQPAPVVPPQGPVAVTPAQLAKLRSEFDIIQQNCKVFSEMLTEMSSGHEHPADEELLKELNQTCRQMQQRLVELVERVQNEEVTGEILHINDELNNIFLRYDRYERLRGGAANPQQQTEQTPQPTLAPSSAALPPPYSATTASQPPSEQPIANLIDLETPSPQPQAAFVQPLIPPINTGGNISTQLAGLSMHDSSVGSTLGQLNTTVATNNAGPEDDFDMFAQSRQTFDQNKDAPPAYNQEDQVGALGAVMTAKATGNPVEPVATGPKESATSSEFDRFLAERAKEADNLPDASPAIPPRRQLQKDDQDSSALFAL